MAEDLINQQKITSFFPPETRDAIVSFLSHLIETPSPSSSEGEVADIIYKKCLSMGFDDVRIDAAGNIIARISRGEGPVLLFDAHMDTARPIQVELADLVSQTVSYDGEVIYGLGTSEAKPAITSILFGLEKFLAEADFQGTLIAVFLVLGNFCEGGSLKLVMDTEDLRPDAIILGEPSDLRIIRGHRGRTHFIVTVKGKSCHSATPQLGKNAIMAASRLLFNIDLLSADLLYDDFLGPGTIAVTEISSEGPALNSLPHTCRLAIDRRLTVGETSSRARSEIENAIIREGINAEIQTARFDAVSYTGYTFNREGSFNAWTLDEKHPLVGTTLAIIRDLAPDKAVTISSTFSTDGAYTMAELGIPTIGLGPGNASFAHTTEEHVRVIDLMIAAQVYYRIAADMLAKKHTPEG